MTEKITPTNIIYLNITENVWQWQTLTNEYDRNKKFQKNTKKTNL